MTEERFDIYDEAMNPIGTASRSEAHANGYWHRTFHCWVIRKAGDQLYVWFQLRQSGKDTYPNCYDITAAGHLSAGENVRAASRELEEELGIVAAFESLIPLGQHREESYGTACGVPFIDREVSEEFACVVDARFSLASLKLQASEVAGVYEAELGAMLALFEGEASSVNVHGVEISPSGELLAVSERSVRADEFVPREAGYYAGVMRALMACH
ncbi:NUDIX hydrolase [Paenibacillus sp. GCM10023252]|uniref:NUDIX hydrolase n=1 Tax=Paenibacillus sp. GCM10023252 TaxID=3252649 RepID=UPI0036D2239C